MRLFLIFVVCVVGSVFANENGKGRGITQPLKENEGKTHEPRYFWSLNSNKTRHVRENKDHGKPTGRSGNSAQTQVWHNGQVVGFNHAVINVLWNSNQKTATNYSTYYSAIMADPSWATWISGNYSVPGWTIPTAGPYAVFAGTYSFNGMSKGKTTDAKIRTQLNTWLQSGALPAPNYYNFYAIHFSSDITIQGFCSSWCAYHDFFTASGSRVNGQVYYALFPYGLNCKSGCLFPNDQSDVSTTKMTISHELAEYMTDPFWSGVSPNQNGGWWDSNEEEIADYCGWFGYPNIPPPMNGLPINYLWSNLDDGCISPPNATVLQNNETLEIV